MEAQEEYYSISQVAEMLDVSAATIRNWEKEFPRFIIVRRDQAQMRFYTEDVIARLRKLKELRDRRTSLPTIKEIVSRWVEQDGPAKPIAPPEQTTAVATTESLKPSPLLIALQKHITMTVGEAVAQEVSRAVEGALAQQSEEFRTQMDKRLEEHRESIRQENERHEERLKEHNKKLDETLRALVNNAQQSQEKRGIFRRLFG